MSEEDTSKGMADGGAAQNDAGDDRESKRQKIQMASPGPFIVQRK